jgi:MoxR-like ATPase
MSTTDSHADFFPSPAPGNARETGIDREMIQGLILKLGYVSSQFSTESTAQKLHLPIQVVGEMLEDLRRDALVEVLGSSGPLCYRYSLSQKGRDRAVRALEISGYLGPAPVSLDAYNQSVVQQANSRPVVDPQQVAESLSHLTMTDEARMLAGLAVTGNRSLFVHGPAGNGKTALCLALRNALHTAVWVPHCFAVENQVVRIYDPQVHEIQSGPAPGQFDARWILVRPPLLVAGGELRLQDLDLAFSPTLRFYEAPIQLKANGGVLLIDDFGRQQVQPAQMLNRWIIPMEYHIDYLTLQTGQKICVPVRQMLLFATNLDPRDVTDPAFLRRMGYRLNLKAPTPQQYARIFENYAQRLGVSVPPGLIESLLDRYLREHREMRCSDSRDLIERARDFCRFNGVPFQLAQEQIDLAWTGFFGSDD